LADDDKLEEEVKVDPHSQEIKKEILKKNKSKLEKLLA
jgi:hypothetical protein